MSQADSAPVAVPPPRRGRIIATYAIGFFVVLPLFLALLGARLDDLFGLAPLGRGWRLCGTVLGGLGLAGLAWTMPYLGHEGRGWPISHLPTKRFVANGPYRIVRHPIYVAYTLAVAGAGLVLGSPGLAFGASAFLLVGWLVYALGFEEPKLVRRFGEAYTLYRASVPILRVPGRRIMRRLAIGLWLGGGRKGVERIANQVVLLRVGPTIWVTYGALLALGVITMGFVTGALLLWGGLSASEVAVYEVWLVAAMLLGGRLVWLVYHVGAIRDHPVRVLRTVGFVSWGALVAAIVLPFVFTGYRLEDSLWLLDRTLLGLVAGAVFGRLGCLTYGCCYGRSSPRGVRWTHPDAKVIRQLGAIGGVPRVPTPLLECAWLLAVFTLAIGATYAAAPSGTVSGLVLILYGLGRLAIDCLRDEARFGPWQLTSGQVGSLVAGTLGFALLFAAHGAPGWTDPAWAVEGTGASQLWPPIMACALFVFVVTAFHWRRVGLW